MALDKGIDEELHTLVPPLEEYAQVEAAMSAPEALADPMLMRKMGRHFVELSRVKTKAERYLRVKGDLAAARELIQEDPSFVSEIPELEDELRATYENLLKTLALRESEDVLDVIFEIKTGEGGEESALSASDLARTYSRYAESKRWSVTELSSILIELGSFGEIFLAIRAHGTPLPEEGVWVHLKYEGGIRRVQHVPITESQGWIHASAAGVFVMPEIEDDTQIVIDPNDLRIDVYCSSGPGRQPVSTMDLAVRMAYIPLRVVASTQSEKSQLQNKGAALRVFVSRLVAETRAEKEAEARAQRLS